MRIDHGTIAKGLAEQDSLVEKGHWVHISLKAALAGSDTQQEIEPDYICVWLGRCPRDVPLTMQHLLLSCYWHHSPMTSIKVGI